MAHKLVELYRASDAFDPAKNLALFPTAVVSQRFQTLSIQI